MKKVLSVSSNDFIENNASLIFSALFYFGGLLVGAFLYKNTEKLLLDTFKKVFSGKNSDLVSMIISRSGFYLSIFCICIILAVCVEGFRIINVIPIFCGIGIAIKLSYYYSLSASGIGFAALLIIPQASLFMTLLIFTIKNCAELSRQIYLLSINQII